MNLSTKVPLNTGASMPILGLGVYMIPNGKCLKAVLDALQMGYRHVDTAAFYANEGDVGRAVRECGIPREELFVTTKLWTADQGYESALKAFEQSRKRLGLDYVDLYLIHWPEGPRLESWKALTELYEEKKCRSVGVSNFTVKHLKDLRKHSSLVPAVNQVEFSPFCFQKELLDYCKDNGIVLQAYAPLTRGEKFNDKTVKAVALKHKRSPAQILIRWCLQHGTVPLPKSAHPDRIRENAQVFDFELDPTDMKALDRLDEGFRTTWNPESVD